MSEQEPRYQVGQFRDGDDQVVWEVYMQHAGPWGTVQIARFPTRKAARDCARRLNAELDGLVS